MPTHSVPSSSSLSPSVFLLCSLLFSLVFAPLALAQATISSPASVTQCLPQQLTISGGEAPYTVTVLPGGETGGQPLETLPTVQQAGTVRWVADIPAGQTITFAVRDNTGAVNFSAQVPVLPGSSSDCLGANASTGSATTTSESASATVSGTTTTSVSTTSGSASRTTSTSTGSGTTSRTTSTTSATATQSGSNGAASLGQCLVLPAAALLAVAALA